MNKDNEQRKPAAVLAGLDSMQGLQAARILAARKVPVIAIAKDPDYHSCKTRVCQEILYCDTQSEALISTLTELGARLDQKAVLYPCQDECVLLISRNRAALEQWYHIVLPEIETVELLMNKIEFYQYAEAQGFPVPKTFVVRDETEAAAAAEAISYPCLMKPSIRTPEWNQHTHLKAFKLDSKEDLLSHYQQYKRFTDAMIIQQWLEGTDSDLYSCNCYYDQSGLIQTTFIARKLRQWPPRTGQSCLGEECRNDMVLTEAIRLFNHVNYRGLGYVEMKRDAKTGDYFIVEPNIGRPTGRSAIAEAGGVELLYTMYCDCTGQELPENRQQNYSGVKWVHILRDIQSSIYYWRRGELTLRGWASSWRGRKAYALFAWNDPLPFLFAMVRGMREILFSGETAEQPVHEPSVTLNQ